MLSLFGGCLIYKTDYYSSSPSPTSNSTSASFGLIISTQFASISFSENEIDLWEALLKKFPKRKDDQDSKNIVAMTYRNLIHQLTSILFHLKEKEKSESSIKSSPSHISNQKLKVTATIRKPRFELFLASNNIFLGIKTNDVSFYEMTPNKYRGLKEENFNFHSDPKMTQGGRLGTEAFRIPFIHRAYGWKGGIAPDNTKHFQPFSSSHEPRGFQSTLLGGHNDYGHAFEIKILFTTKKSETSTLPLKTVQLFIDFYDIVLCHDPQSLWIFKMINVLTPKRPLDVMANNVEDFLYQISLYKKHLTKENILLLGEIKAKLSDLKYFKDILEKN